MGVPIVWVAFSGRQPWFLKRSFTLSAGRAAPRLSSTTDWLSFGTDIFQDDRRRP